MKAKKKILLYGFGGVALADILANSVVVLLVVIILTLSITKQKTEREVEQSAEISAILARDIASTLVFNDLPSSPPAVLHNYNCQQPNGPWRSQYEQHDCQPWLYPVIEFHSDYIREASTNRRFSREILLEENNEFDAYLRSLPPAVKQRIRADIIHLDLYYLGISIMKENNARPNHWHFVGEDFQPADVLGYLDRGRDEEESDTEYNTTGFADGENGEGENGEGESDSTEESGQGEADEAAEQEIIPDDVSLRSADRIDNLLPPTEAGLSRNGIRRQERNEGLEELEGEFGGSGEEGEYSDELANALLEAIVEERSGGTDEFGRPSSVRIRLPGAGDQESLEESALFGVPLDSIINSITLGDGEPLDYHTFMIILVLEYLKQGSDFGFDRVSIQSVFAQIRSGAVDIPKHPLLPFAMKLQEEMRVAFAELENPLEVRRELCVSCLSKMSMGINSPLNYVELETANAQRFLESANIINTRLQLYRYPDRGDQTEILNGDTLLMHPDTISNDKGWYAVAVLDPNISDLVVGYVYGQVADEKFNALGDVNLLKVDQQTLKSELSFYPLRREVILGVLYGFLTLSILAVFLYLTSGFRTRRYG
ncbi:MAG: hypothetical protein K0U41_05600 [Gammaproteobacteria bacterium]|nr:hypothetical protein [Gammaproteobacteria bacterium]